MDRLFENKKISVIFWSMLTACILLLLPTFVRKLACGHLTAAAIVVVCGYVITLRKSLKDVKFTATSLGLKKQEGRDMRYDWLRLICILMVIMVHAIDGRMPFISEPGNNIILGYEVHAGDTFLYLMHILRLICMSGNMLFLMLSGALLLRYRENEGVGGFYYKRFLKVIIPMAAATAFYLWIGMKVPKVDFQYLRDVVHNIWVANYDDTPFYWILYVILSLYVVFPFFRYMFKDMPYKVLTSFVAVCIIFMFLQSGNRTNPIQITTFMAQWMAFPVMGYWLVQPETEKYYRPLKILGLLSLIYCCLLIRKYGDYSAYTQRIMWYTPTLSFLVMGEFALIFDVKAFRKKQNVFLRFFGRYSFSIILIHWFCLHFITRRFLRVLDPTVLGLGIAYDFIVTVLTSMAVAFIFENYVVGTVTHVIEKAVSLIKKILLPKFR